MKATHLVHTAFILMLAGFSTAAFAAPAVPTFQPKLPDKLTYNSTQQRYLNMTINGRDSGVKIKHTVECHNVLTKQEGGGYLLNVTIKSAYSTVDFGQKTAPIKSSLFDELKGMNFTLEYSDKFESRGYFDGKTPKAWLKDNLSEQEFAHATRNGGDYANIDDDLGLADFSESTGEFMQYSLPGYDPIDFIFGMPVMQSLADRPAGTGACWYDKGFVASSITENYPGYSAWKVAKREKAGGKNCLRIEEKLNHDAAALAKKARCKEKEITDVVSPPDDPQSLNVFLGIANGTLSTWEENYYIVDPATLLRISQESKEYLSCKLNLKEQLGEEFDPKKYPAILNALLTIRTVSSYKYD